MERRKEVDKGAAPFDTLAYAKKLELRGVETKQAEAHAEVLADVLEANFATKQDVVLAVNNLSQDINSLRNDMNMKFAAVDARFAGIDAKFVSIDARFDGVASEFAAMRSEIKMESAVLRSEMTTGFSGVRIEMQTMFSAFKSELIKWVLTIALIQTTLIIGVAKLFH